MTLLSTTASVKHGVREASKIRVRELSEDYPWVDRFLGPLKGISVPCGIRRYSEGLARQKKFLTDFLIRMDRAKLSSRLVALIAGAWAFTRISNSLVSSGVSKTVGLTFQMCFGSATALVGRAA